MHPYSQTMFDLTGRVAIITGGAGTLGRQYALTLASAGASIVVADIDEVKTNAVAAELPRTDGARHIGLRLNVADPESVRKGFSVVEKEYGRLDILINNAGVSGKFSPANVAPTFENYPLEEWRNALDINLTGMFLCAQAAGPIMKRGGGGSIINVSSTYGLVSPDQRLYQQDAHPEKTFIKPISYSVSKSGVLNFTRYLATYYAADGVRVNTLTPGGVDDGTLSEEFRKKYSDRTPLKRMADPVDYNGAVLYLSSDASRYMTGANVVVDGGWTAW